ncbi:hypothetical protein [Novosphingobium marinum]|uniref:DUF2059 domain-containing protein n=1 Tax=Novosphingobium marinum TaxID=1514948 RepID=A0A7Y9XUS8_9SPHN|nr:hypothetical protein [Novosphingobium marinum]NYH94855.1 hypothetical protein [Novosphingobium marinum]
MTRLARMIPAIAALSLAVPAMAQDSGAADIADELSDPVNQIAVTAAISAMSEALLDLEIEPFVKAMEAVGRDDSVRDLPPDARLRDLAGPEAEALPAEMASEVPRMMGRMAQMADAMDAMLPGLRDMAERMKDAIPRE